VYGAYNFMKPVLPIQGNGGTTKDCSACYGIKPHYFLLLRWLLSLLWLKKLEAAHCSDTAITLTTVQYLDIALTAVQ